MGGYNSRFRHFAYHTLLEKGLLRYVALSDTNYLQVKKEYPRALSRCIYNGRAPMLPTKNFKQTGDEIDSYKENDQTCVVLHVARCDRAKNQRLLIDSFNELRKLGCNIVLLIIGAHFDSEEGKKLQALGGDGVHFLGTRKNIADYMLQSDVFALSSSFEGMPITLIEAMLSGTPMVSTPVTGAVDVINGKNGVLSKDFTEPSYISALKEVVDHNQQYKEYTLKHKDDSPFTIRHCAEQYMDFYRTPMLIE